MKVVHVVDSFGMGGAETWLLSQLKFANNNPKVGLELFFIVTGSEKGELADKFENLSAGVFYLHVRRGMPISDIVSLRKFISSSQFQAIHFHSDFLSGFLQLFLVGCLPRIVIAHFHNPKYQQDFIYATSIRRRLSLMVAKVGCALLSTHFLGTSNYVLEAYRCYSPLYFLVQKKAQYCFFNLNDFRCSKPHKREDAQSQILFVGRFDQSIEVDNCRNHKNTGLVLRILAALVEAGHDVQLDMLGKNEHSLEAHKALINDLNIKRRVNIHGVQNDINPFLKQADLLLFPSREEGMGLVAVEAQLARVPVLKSEGVPDEVVCVPGAVRSLSLNSSIDEWVDAVVDLLTTNIDWSREDFSLFDIDNQIHNLIAVYNET